MNDQTAARIADSLESIQKTLGQLLVEFVGFSTFVQGFFRAPSAPTREE